MPTAGCTHPGKCAYKHTHKHTRRAPAHTDRDTDRLYVKDVDDGTTGNMFKICIWPVFLTLMRPIRAEPIATEL